MDQIEDELGNEEDDPYMSVDLVELMKRATEQRKSFQLEPLPIETVDCNTIQSGPVSVLQHRIGELKVCASHMMWFLCVFSIINA